MKLRGTIFLVCLLVKSLASAQSYSKWWVLGPNTSVIDFGIDSATLGTISHSMNTWQTNANICDTAGDLLYFTNGFYVADKNGNGLINGDTLSPSTFTNDNYGQGDPLPQAAIFLPQPGNPQYYYLFHFGEDTLNRPSTIYYSLIDKGGNSGLGAVVRKNVPILKLQGTNILRGGGMTACKHANGRDYWIVMPGSNNNEFYKFLLTPESIAGPLVQYIGPTFPTPDDIAYSKFSQDGSKYVTSCAEGLVLVMDFDRCSGEFSNPQTIFHYAGIVANQPVSGACSEEFSPSGRFLYVNNIADLTQYDLWAGNIQDSVELYVSDSSDYYGLNMLQLAPNGKLYCSTYDGGLDALHVVNLPDSAGDSSHFVYGGQPTLSLNSFNLPNMINYNLGSLIGSGCDTLTSISNGQLTAESILRIMPNPADKYVYVEMDMQGNYEFDLLNAMGQVIGKKETRQVDIFDTEHLTSGVYFIRAIDRKNVDMVATRKVVVMH